jgi:predicted DNA-binding protein (MmcQ/YjbR family)
MSDTTTCTGPSGVVYGFDVTRDEVLDLCTRLPGAVEDYPFGDGVAVFKVGGRMFALVPLDTADGAPATVNLKCDPDLAIELRARYAAVRPGYHQNKRHWNTVDLDGSVDDGELREMVEHSYELVLARLPRRERDRLSGRPIPHPPPVDGR